ncbi:unnamed protein product [Lactuca virosa]|uniref:Uncharacterized protein n=1 Tax=Lactuca virosa TaxID=75947 RepID=A0AAU9LH52_9ASTR|nr:unnamed protein product [Lactuca virosa]
MCLICFTDPSSTTTSFNTLYILSIPKSLSSSKVFSRKSFSSLFRHRLSTAIDCVSEYIPHAYWISSLDNCSALSPLLHSNRTKSSPFLFWPLELPILLVIIFFSSLELLLCECFFFFSIYNMLGVIGGGLLRRDFRKTYTTKALIGTPHRKTRVIDQEKMAEDESRTLEVTPTWAVTTVTFSLIAVSILIDHVLHLLAK